MIIVTGTLHARAATYAEVLALSRAHVLRSRAEPGCLEHGVAVDAVGATFFETPPADLLYLKLAAQRGLGRIDLEKMAIEKRTV